MNYLKAMLVKSGVLLGILRLVARACKRAMNRVWTIWWKLHLAELGSGTVIQFGVHFENPKQVRIGRSCLICSGSYFYAEGLDGSLIIANDVQINRNVTLDHSGSVTLWSGVLVSEGALIYSHDHGHDPRSSPRPLPKTIHEGAWIGARALLLHSCTSVGSHAVIGAGAVVHRDVSPSQIVAGNPAVLIVKRTPIA